MQLCSVDSEKGNLVHFTQLEDSGKDLWAAALCMVSFEKCVISKAIKGSITLYCPQTRPCLSTDLKENHKIFQFLCSFEGFQ